MAVDMAGEGGRLRPPSELAGLRPELRDRASYLLLDTIGAALGGHSAPATRQVLSLLRPADLSALDAALILGTACQALDLDETNLPARCHIAAAIIPALIGAAMSTRPTWRGIHGGSVGGL